MELVRQVLVSLLTSVAVMAALAFLVRKYFTRYIDYTFDRKIKAENLHADILAEIKREFLNRSLEVYSQTPKLAFACLLRGRELAVSLRASQPIALQDAWQSFREFQAFLGNQTFLDAKDYQHVHKFKRDLELFLTQVQSYADKRGRTESDCVHEEDKRLAALWNETAEVSFSELQKSLRLFSIRSDA